MNLIKSLLTTLTVALSTISWGQTLIMNEVSQGVTGNMEYVEFVVVDNTVTYDCNASTPPSIDIRGWIFDDNSGYHGAVGVASGAIRFSFDPLWSAVPLGTIILIYNDAAPDPSIPPADLSLNDGNCMISAPISNPSLFESNATTPGAIACSYPAAGWTPGGNWSNTLLANGGDCARIVDLNGCEVFSVCYGTANQNTLIYFLDGADPSAVDHRNTVYYFNDGDPVIQANWSIGCTDNEITLDANQCGANFQTPGAPNNPANAAYIAQFNNGCVPITPVALSAVTDNNELCVCDGQATATGSGSIGPYTYEWFDVSMNPIGQTSSTATGLCDGTYYVEVTSSIGCQEIVMITIAPGAALPTATLSGGNTYCAGESVANIETAVTGSASWIVSYTFNGTPQTATGNSSPISLGNTPGTYVLSSVSDANCSNTAVGTETIIVNPLPTASISGGNSYCSGEVISDIEVNATGSPDWTVSYTINGGATLTVTSGASLISLGNAPGVYTLTAISDANCSNTATGTESITIVQTPIISPIANTTVCDSYTLPTITGVNLSGSEAFYNNSQANGGTVITGPITSTQTVWIYDAQGSCSDEESFNVTIDLTPAINDPGAQTACDSYALAPITGTNITAAANYYTNTPSQGGNLLIGPITSSQTIWIYDADGVCADSLSFLVTINASPVLTITNPAAVCEPLTIDLTAASVTAGSTNATTLSYWIDATGTTPLANASSVTTSGTYYIQADNAGCTDIAPVVATISPIPVAPIAGTNATYCSVWTIVPLTASGTGGTYTWYNEAGSVVGTGPTYTPSNAIGTNTFSVTETVAGCQGPASDVTIVVNSCEITLPTAFTPDGDGVNENWEIVDLDAVYPGNVVTIYNRWGNMLYKHDSTVDGPYDSDRWDGTYNGDPLPVGSYYYIIDLGSLVEGEESISGTVSILKGN